MAIPFVDIFAGPGGLGEGFSSYKSKGEHVFRPVLSIEKEDRAHKTLTLRSFFRQFPHSGRKVPKEYYDYLSNGNKNSINDLFATFPEETARAKAEAKKIKLGGEEKEDDPSHVRDLIDKAVGKNKNWILLGGPPCQAYSLVGRSRMGGISSTDPRVELYKHYLWILANHKPTAFIFENVKGLASSKINDKKIFEKITTSLQNPAAELEGDKQFVISSTGKSASYRLFGLEVTDDNKGVELDFFENEILDLNSLIIKAEKHGIPQTRHRIIILGIRTDLGELEPAKLKIENTIPAGDVLNDLTRLRSGLSKQQDGNNEWVQAIKAAESCFLKSNKMDQILLEKLLKELDDIKPTRSGRGGEFVSSKRIGPKYQSKWYVDAKLNGFFNHSTRSHIKEDLHRYLFASTYAKLKGVSPKLENFPKALLPKHKNTQIAIKRGLFNDRFRVQVIDRPSTTITSHISKDGHYYIHPDPSQCRSLTVREAARLQTFPDNYFFCGPRTSQYTQVGNAVPPFLANKIAAIVHKLLDK